MNAELQGTDRLKQKGDQMKLSNGTVAGYARSALDMLTKQYSILNFKASGTLSALINLRRPVPLPVLVRIATHGN